MLSAGGIRTCYLIACLHVLIQFSVMFCRLQTHLSLAVALLLCYRVVILLSIFVLFIMEPINMVATLRHSSGDCHSLDVLAVLISDQPLNYVVAHSRPDYNRPRKKALII